MSKATRLKELIEAPDILVMPGAHDPLSAILIQEAGFDAVQASGLGISAAHMGLPDASLLSMREMAERTAAMAAAVDIPLMADGDTGYGNAVNVWYTVEAFERAGAAGINLEDQVMPKRCGHLAGKEVIPAQEMAGKIAAAAEARNDPNFVINARTDALAVEGVEAVVSRAKIYFEAGATMVFVDGVDSRDTIAALVDRIGGPLAVNMVEGGKTPLGLTFADLQAMGVARVSLPVSLLLASIHAMRTALATIRERDGTGVDPSLYADFTGMHRLVGMEDVYAREARFLDVGYQDRKYTAAGGRP
ncbi:oxaloacetate decarboxylase [Puniceibacterium sp. IMCC21224]|uniref:isocitrate lyase/PEP mutase family protein n=1 Tax=Puniceibacterium sp. IMCC21224 TaxID=1618204 RepID=UPI00064DBDB3|nr:isocitrate lyase/PEP mutase family protein [Puniceibacterium sp. IMCC21224]KMK64887.1 PEP phosphonomutase-like enzyme [Puniceibacterium sp. IMCC21224]